MFIYANRGTPVHTEPSIHAYTYTSKRTRMHEGMGCRQTQKGPPMRVCVRIYTWHPHVLGFTIVDTDAHCADGHTTSPRAHTLSHGIYAHSHKWTYQMHISWARACAAPAVRSHARTHTHTHLQGTYMHTHLQAHVLTQRGHSYVHTCAYICRKYNHIYIYI
jgi:hypothetical protein